MVLKRDFYSRDSLIVAKELLGKILVHKSPEGLTSGYIVETEAYKGPEDKASHAYAGKRTARTETMFGPKGHAYIYLIYGMYHCLNATSGSVEGKPEATLIRALEPIEGLDLMLKRRGSTGKKETIASGPGRLCIAMGLTKKQNNIDLCNSSFYITEGKKIQPTKIMQVPRIGVDYAHEHKDLPWRFYLKENPYVSIKLKN